MRRSSRVFLVLCWLVLLVVPSGVRADGNLVVNGGFEAGEATVVPHWTSRPFSAEVTGVLAHTGDKSLHTTTTGGGVTEVYQAVDISAYGGRSVEVLGYMYGTSPVSGRIEAALSDDAGCSIAPSARILVGDLDGNDGSWIEAKRTVQIPEAPSYVYLCVLLTGEEDQLYFDDISVVVETPTAVGLGGLRASGGAGVMVALGLAAAAAMMGRPLRRVRR